MGFWILRRKTETMEEKAARRARSAERDVQTYDAIMAAFVQPLPTFSQWPGQVGANQPPTYENIGHTTYYPATYYPNQSYAHPYGQQAYPYQSCPSSTGSLASSEVLPTYVDSTYNPYARQMFFWQLPPFLMFGIYSAFLHPLLKPKKKEMSWDDEEAEAVVVTRVKRRIEVKYGIYCVLSLCLWILLISGMVVLIVRDSDGGGANGKEELQKRWMDSRLRETWNILW